MATHSAKVVTEQIGAMSTELRDMIAAALQLQKDMASSIAPMAAQSRINMIWSWWGAFASIMIGGLFFGMNLAKFL
ncbi:hypothetical protein [Granulibacter bethesdensis]|uniref:hypothetical protein n=1 Tax=Granulibacter bethesdensis TaxID=364410 RepID=UPI0012FDB44B|nr:hypothetical protein [Granulibacter bethesdensis]